MNTNLLDLTPSTRAKYDQLCDLLRGMGRVVIGFSGGVDSTLLLRVALDTLGADNVLAIIGNSPSFPAREFDGAKALAEEMGVPYRVLECSELEDPRYAANPADRCYYCKTELFSRLGDIARGGGYAAVLDGNNADDMGDYRPGQQAGRELGVRSPLMEVGMSKAKVREISRALGLATWNKPSFACLASRIPYGTPITKASLSTIERAEDFLRDLGFAQVRVRHHGDVARIEVASEDIARLLDETLRARIADHLKSLGYHFVSVDLQGYRTGSMNAGL